MTIEDLQTICRQQPGITEDIKWDYHLCFNVGGKMFLLTSPDEVPPSASFKTTPERFAELLEQPGFSPASHLARYHWVHLDDIARLGPAQWEQCIRESYRLVAEKLPAKARRVLGV
jgi:predicted DNA-binding protein (MmcQ/YjbR family)